MDLWGRVFALFFFGRPLLRTSQQGSFRFLVWGLWPGKKTMELAPESVAFTDWLYRICTLTRKIKSQELIAKGLLLYNPDLVFLSQILA